MKHRVLNYCRTSSIITLIGIGTLFLISLLTACTLLPKAAIIVAGSTSVQPFAELLAEDYMRQHPDVTIDIQGGGSAAGIMAASSGTADIGMSSRELHGDEKSLWYVEIAKDGLAVIVNPDNPVGNLTLNQVRDIYTLKIDRWDLLGGPKAKIHVVVREEGSGTRSAFEDLVMDKVEINPKAIVQDSNGAVRELVAGDPSAIGFISLGLVNERVKALELDGVEATRENVIKGSYRLSRPFFFLSRTQPAGQTKDFIGFTLSEGGKRLLTDEGLIIPGEGGGN